MFSVFSLKRAGVRLVTAAAAAAMAFAPTASAQSAPKVTWEACPPTVDVAGAHCGQVSVPMRYDQPDGRQISVGFIQIKAQNPAAKRGVLFGNSGGPGGDAYTYFGAQGVNWPEEIRNEWDMVAVQPRGLAHSTPLKCEGALGEDPLAVARERADMTLNMGGYMRRICQTGEPGYPETITTDNNARDWEMVRQALSYDKISIMGLSYGTYLGSAYATMYPAQTDKVVLDSAMDPNMAWNDLLASQQGGYESALHEYFAWVAMNNDTYGMGDTPLKAYQYWSRKVVAETGTNPTVVPPPARVGDLPPGLEAAGQAGADAMTATGKARVEGEGVVSRLLNPGATQTDSGLLRTTRLFIPMPAQWHQLATLTNGTADTGGEAPPQPVIDELNQIHIHTAQLLPVQTCNENITPADYSLIPLAVWSNWISQDPFTAPNAMMKSGIACSGAEPVTKRSHLDGSKLAVRPLQINATRDPQTVYEGRGTLHTTMGTQLVTVHGPGHGHVATGNPAVERLVVDYLRTGKASTLDAPGYFEAQGQ